MLTARRHREVSRPLEETEVIYGVAGFLSLGACNSHTSQWSAGTVLRCGTQTTVLWLDFLLNVWMHSPQLASTGDA
jgi:hypothetical protein